MKPEKSASLVRRVVELGKSLGELNHRSFLLKDHLRTLDAQAREDFAFQKRKMGHMPESRRAEYKRALRDHYQHLMRTRHLEREELQQVTRLAREVEDQVRETTSNLLERIIHG